MMAHPGPAATTAKGPVGHGTGAVAPSPCEVTRLELDTWELLGPLCPPPQARL